MKKKMFLSLISVSSMTLISRIIGFLRDVLIAKYFGVSGATDAFNVAFKLPNFLRRIFAEGAFSQAFVPILSEYRNNKSQEETNKFVSSVMGMLFLILLITVLIGIVFSSYIILITSPGFTTNIVKFNLTVSLLRITFPYILFISLASLISGVLNTWGVFAIPSFTPTILNLTFIFFIVFFNQAFHPSVLCLAWAVFIGGILQLLFQIPFYKKLGFNLKPIIDFKNKNVLRVIKLMFPAIFAVSVSQISMIINTIYASYLQTGSVSWMYYADRLMEFPTGVLGVGLGTILLPSLSKYSMSNHLQFSKTLDWGIRLCLLLAVPATVGIAMVSKLLIVTLFMHGKFNSLDVIMTQKALIGYSIGLIGIILVKVLGPGFYANQDIKTPVKIAVLVLICIQFMNFLFIGHLKHAGLALSIGLGACINAGVLCYLLIKRKIYTPQQGWAKFLIKIILATIIMCVTVLIAMRLINLSNYTSNIKNLIVLALYIVIASCSYFISLFILGIRLKQFTSMEY